MGQDELCVSSDGAQSCAHRPKLFIDGCRVCKDSCLGSLLNSEFVKEEPQFLFHHVMVVVAVGIASQFPFIFFVFIGRFVSQWGEGVGIVQCDAHHGAGTVQEQARIQSFLQVFLQIVHLGVTPF